MKVVIIGNGTAGNEAAFFLRRQNKEIEINIISKEEFAEYDPCSLTYFIGKDVKREMIFRKEMHHYKDANINLVLKDEVSSINTTDKTIITKSKTLYEYDKLILAYGGNLFVPPIKGVNTNGVFGCKQLKDADNLFKRKGKAAVVIGSGAIGIEAAEALKKRNYNVTIIELQKWILPTMFDEVAGKKLGKAMENYGISVLVDEMVVSIEGKNKVEAIVTNKRKIDCDTVVMATGVVINKTLANLAKIDIDKGIMVNENMETNILDIYACGDCAQTRDVITGDSCIYQLKHNAIDQARIVAQNILGTSSKYQGAYAFARAHFFDTHSATFGKTQQSLDNLTDIEIIEKNTGNNYLKVIAKNGQIIGAQTIGPISDQIGLLMAAAWRKDDIRQLRNDWSKICSINAQIPFGARQLGVLLGMDYYSS